MRVFIVIALLACAYAAEVEKKEKEDKPVAENKDKRQTLGEVVPSQYVYRTARKQERVTPVEESQEEDKAQSASNSRAATEEYRPGQVYSLNTQELLELQQERKSPSQNNQQQLQQLYSSDEAEHRQNLQQLQQMYTAPLTDKQLQQYNFYYDHLRQVTLQPSRTVIARPPSSANGGEASVGAALSVADTASNENLDQELLALLGNPGIRQEEPQAYTTAPQTYSPAPQAYSPPPQAYSPAPQAYSPAPQAYSPAPQAYSPAPQAYSPAPQVYSPQPQLQQVAPQSVAPQYQQVDRYIAKPTKKPTKLRTKLQNNPPQAPAAPQQYLIETTNVAQQPAKPQQQQQYRLVQQQRPAPAVRYVNVQIPQNQAGPVYYERPESQGLNVVSAPKLQQPRAQQIAYRLVPASQYQEASPKQFRVVEARPQPAREQPRQPASSIDRPVAYIKSYHNPEKQRAIKIYQEQVVDAQAPRQNAPQYIGEQYYLRPLYRQSEPQPRYEQPQPRFEQSQPRFEQPQPQATYIEQSKPPHSAIFVNKNIVPKKPQQAQQPQQQPQPQPQPRPQLIRVDQPVGQQSVQVEQPRVQQVNIEQHGQSIEEQRAALPPPRNNKAYTPQEFALLVAAGYSVTPVPVASSPQYDLSRSSSEPEAPMPVKRRPLASRRHQYLPLRSDEAP